MHFHKPATSSLRLAWHTQYSESRRSASFCRASSAAFTPICSRRSFRSFAVSFFCCFGGFRSARGPLGLFAAFPLPVLPPLPNDPVKRGSAGPPQCAVSLPTASPSMWDILSEAMISFTRPRATSLSVPPPRQPPLPLRPDPELPDRLLPALPDFPLDFPPRPRLRFDPSSYGPTLMMFVRSMYCGPRRF